MDQNGTTETTPEPKPWELLPDAGAAMPAATAPVPTEAAVGRTASVGSVAALVIASSWMVISILAGLVFMTTEVEIFLDDASLGAQVAVVTATKALGFVIIGTGVLGLVIALDRRVTKS